MKNPAVDEYISKFPPKVQRLLEQLRTTIRAAAPEATEVISYSMPTYKLGGPLVYFAGWKAHVALYPTPSATGAFAKRLAPYAFAKGSIQFPLDAPLPLELVTDIVKFRAKEVAAKAKAKPKTKPKPKPRAKARGTR